MSAIARVCLLVLVIAAADVSLVLLADANVTGTTNRSLSFVAIGLAGGLIGGRVITTQVKRTRTEERLHVPDAA